MYGGIEAGGTKLIGVIGTGPHDIRAETRIATSDPMKTLDQAIQFFRGFQAKGAEVRAIGIASFGPVELRPGHPKFGYVTTTPKPNWSDVDIAGTIADALQVPIGFDTDVNGAALAERRWGAARSHSTFVYLTIGTGIGGGAMVDGGLLHGLVHPEMGHIAVPRQPGDTFTGACPFHGDCFEGMASGTALRMRWGRPVDELTGPDRELAVALEAAYVAAGITTIVYTLAPSVVVVGGGVAEIPGLLPAVRAGLDSLAAYPGLPEHRQPEFVVPAQLGSRAGALGALILAELAAGRVGI